MESAAGLTMADFGELNPVFDNTTVMGKLRNRRVDILVKPVVM